EHVRLDGVEFYPIDNLVTEEREFRVGNLHMTDSVPLDLIPVYQRDHPEELVNHPYIGSYFYRFNITKPPLDDRRVRRALQISLNREMITQNVLKAGEQPAYFYTPPDTAGYTCEYKVPFDVEEGKRLLAEAGYPGGQGFPKVDILYNTLESHKLIAEAAQRMWKESLGVEVGLFNQDWKTYLNSMDTLDYDICRSSWIADCVDPINFLECFLSNSGNNRTGYKSVEYDRLINAAYNETDTEKRMAYMQQAEALLLDDAVVVPVYFYRWVFLVKPEVQGFVPNSRGYRRWKDMWLASEATN
ncbi:MAG: peptide ABC transporter substrate-binding protein, partial [Candidatus Hydrogenedentes bacterium]|nr:peptide ABC transporter substrate-binding protein [Candidatus Hydrogenedentota bacterium]